MGGKNMAFYGLLNDDQKIQNIYLSKHEYKNSELKTHSRFRESSYSKHSTLYPVVSKYLNEELNYKPIYPEDKKFVLCLSHDVDYINYPKRHLLKSFFYSASKLNFSSFRSDLYNYSIKNSPYKKINNIIDLEKKYGAKSTFFIMTTKKDVKEIRYQKGDIESIIGDISDSEFEIGLHGGYYSYNDQLAIKTEKKDLEKIINKKVVGNRFHYLRFETSKTWNLLSKANFLYDSTYGFNDFLGFRNGICYPFIPYDYTNGSEISIMEIPLNVMDITLFRMTNDWKSAFNLVKYFISIVKRYSGVFTLNWHSDSFNSSYKKNYVSLYEKILNFASNNDAWITSCESLINWCNR